MDEPRETDEPTSPYAVPLSSLEQAAHVEPDERVEEIGEPPNPDLIPEERRRLENFLKWGSPGG